MINKRVKNCLAILIVLLIFNLPIVTALELSEINAVNITDTSAVVQWKTDEPANSFVSYGEEMQTVGDAALVTQHNFPLTGLTPDTEYQYSVKSNDVIADNNGSLYSFKTLPVDTTAPVVEVEFPAFVKGSNLDLRGMTEAGAVVSVFVNGVVIRTSPAVATNGSSATFEFKNLQLKANEINVVAVEVKDSEGNKASKEGRVFADTNKPTLILQPVPAIANDSMIELKGVVSEESTFSIKVNDQDVADGNGTILKQEINLQEGSNNITITLTDQAGWEVIKELKIKADTQDPTVTAELERGTEYYQGRAKSAIHGKTEPGATVYLFVYKPIGPDSKPRFDRAWEKVAADEKGEFSFEEVNFENEPLNLEDLAPKEVPSGLQEAAIFPVEQIANQDQRDIHIYLIAEDQSGKTGYWETTLIMNTCFTGNFDFTIEKLAQFQAPLRLNPQLLDEGREAVQAVFNLSYRGKGVAKLDYSTGREIEARFRILNVDFEKACTQGMEKDEKFKIGCQIMPNGGPRTKTNNIDKTAWYITYNLQSSKELSEAKESFWDEFKKRQIVFPLKIKVNYQDRNADGSWSETKMGTQCTDISYLVDIPVDSKKMLPDFLTDEGLTSINWTIEKIDLILPYLEKAILVTGVGCISSFLMRMAMRWARIFTSKMESFSSKVPQPGDKDKKACPLDQKTFHLKSTIEEWKKDGVWNVISTDPTGQTQIKDADGKAVDYTKLDELVLDERCPWTTSMWKAEALLDQAYRWTCDRVFCRAVPAGWTSSKDKSEVDTVILKQSQCSVSSNGIPLIERENCQDLVKQNAVHANPTVASTLISQGAFTCYSLDNRLYHVTKKDQLSTGEQVVELELVDDLGPKIGNALTDYSTKTLFAYRPPNSDRLIVGTDQTCAMACKNQRKPGYKADINRSVTNFAQGTLVINQQIVSVSQTVLGPNGTSTTTTSQNVTGSSGGLASGKYGCYQEVVQGIDKQITLKDGTGKLIGTGTYSAGYTKDCFVHFTDAQGNRNTPKSIGINGTTETGLLQCVCTLDKEAGSYYLAREAMKETKGVAEPWDYRENEIFKSDQRYGTYYPEWRYYKGRDFSSAFGADYVLDYINPGPPEVHQVNPSTQFLGVYQTLCLSRIRAHLKMLRSILEGLKLCITEAKVTGLYDAGTCKTLFAQHVCGLLYKVIAYFFTKCSPYSAGDAEGGALDGVGYAFQAGFSSIGESMESSISDIKADYGNAKLNEYFATGAQGFAQSMCMAAFGYDWPLGMDFILDAAYSVPGKTTVLVVPAERELATYNPSKGTAVYNYNVGAMILPGCKIQSYDVYLKCVGVEDSGHPGIKCEGQNCDCLRLRNPTAAEGERTHYLDNGRGFDLSNNDFFDVPLPNPQKVDAQFRYDHVVVELKLDPYESADKCFDEGYRDGKFYFPIVDITPPGVAVCQAQYETGKYTCPEIQGMFGGAGGSYLEDPFISCYDKTSGSWASCDTPNLFVKGDEIKYKVHVYSDGKGQCLKISASGLTPGGLPYEETQKLYENLPGPNSFPISLGTVTDAVLEGSGGSLQKAEGSTVDCAQPMPIDATQMIPSGVSSFTFSYTLVNGIYTVDVYQQEVTVAAPYQIVNKHLVKADGTGLTAAELSQVVFSFNGYRARNVIGTPATPTGTCVYKFSTSSNYGANQYSYTGNTISSQGYYPTTRQVTVRAQILQPDVSGGCSGAYIPVKSANIGGKPEHTAVITIQKESITQQIESRMHQYLIQGNYNNVQNNANGIINEKKRNLEEVVAIYYYVAALIAQSKDSWSTVAKDRVCQLVNIFNYGYEGQATRSYGYGPEVTNTAEYQKIKVYLGEIGTKAGCSKAET